MKPKKPRYTVSQEKAMEFALKSITAKRQSVQEMRERLEKRFPQVDREAIIQRLKELEYLNDEAFCEAWVRHRSLTSPRGKYALNQELRKKGIDGSLIDQVLEAFEEFSVIDEVAEKKWQRISGDTLQKRKEKLMRFLLSRGFAISEVLDCVKRVAETPED